VYFLAVLQSQGVRKMILNFIEFFGEKLQSLRIFLQKKSFWRIAKRAASNNSSAEEVTLEDLRRIFKFIDGFQEVLLAEKHVVGAGIRVSDKDSVYKYHYIISVTQEDHGLPIKNGDLIGGIPVVFEVTQFS